MITDIKAIRIFSRDEKKQDDMFLAILLYLPKRYGIDYEDR